jgi:hypothetical protein
VQRRIVALDHASPSQVELTRELRRITAPPGAVSGIMLGDGPWDIRMLSVEGGSQWITRQVDPALKLDRENFDRFRILLGVVRQVANKSTAGEYQSTLWYRRPYGSKTLEDTGALNLFDPLVVIKTVIKTIEAYHAADGFHGHIALSNIIVLDDELLVVDPGFAGLCPSARVGRSAIAPEIISGQPISQATDLYGLGVICKKVLGSRLISDEVTHLVEAMLSHEPSRRPSIHWVQGVFDGISEGEGQPMSRPAESTGQNVPKGAMIVIQPATPKIVGGIPKTPAARIPTDIKPLPPPPTTPTMHFPVVAEEPKPHETRRKAPPSAQQPPPKAPPPAQKNNSTLYMVITITAVVVGLYRYLQPAVEPAIPFDAYWGSGQPSYMKQVATAAVERGNQDAMLAIFDAAARGVQNPMVRVDLLKLGTDQRWEAELSIEDRVILLKVAISQLLSRGQQEFILAPTVHPGVVYSLLATMSIDAGGAEFATLPLVRLADLPAPLGPLFLSLEKLGIRSLEDPVVRALAHISAGDQRPEVLKGFLAPFENDGLVLAKIDLLRPLFTQQPALGDALCPIITSSSIGGLLTWFDNDELSIWRSVKPTQRLGLAFGEGVSAATFEQSVDLLAYPRVQVKKSAGENLFKDPAATSIRDIIPVLVSPENDLTRSQAILLASALRTSGPSSHAFISKWLKTNPSATVVAALVAARSGVPDTDAFNLESARYLTSLSQVTLPPETLAHLAVHPEPLIRAFAYSKLKTDQPAHRAILRTALQAEKSPRLKEDLEERLARAMR